MQFGVVRMCREQGAVSRLCLPAFARSGVEFGEIALQGDICRVQLHRRLQFRDRLVVFTLCRQDPAQLDMGGGMLGVGRDNLSQLRFRVGEAAAAHVDVGQPDCGLRRLRIDRQNLLVLLLGVRVLILFFEEKTGR